MGFVRALFTLLITAIVYACLPYPVVIAVGLTLAVTHILTVFIGRLAGNFFVACGYLMITSAILTLICMGVDDVSSRVGIWVVANLHLLGVVASFLIVFAEDIYYKNVESYSGTYGYAERYARHKILAKRKYTIKWLILFSPLIIVEIMLAFFIKDNAIYGFINSGVYLLVGILFYLAMKIKHIQPELGSSKIESFSDLLKATGNLFVKPGKEFVAFFVKLGRFFKNLFTGKLFKRKPKVKRKKYEKKGNTYKTKRSFRLPSFTFNSYALFFIIPVVVCGLTFLFCELGWFSGGDNFFIGLNDKVNFVDGYGKWAETIQDWLQPALGEIGTIGGILAFIIILPLTLVAYVLEGAWWLISWALIGIVKLLILLVGKIIFIIPFVLFGGGVVADVIFLVNCDDKETSAIVSFILSLALCLMFGVLILV